MRYDLISIDDADCSIQPDGDGMISREARSFVLRREVSDIELKGLLNNFIDEFRAELLAILSMRPAEFREFNPNKRFIFDPINCPPDTIVAYKRGGSRETKMNWLIPKRVLEALIEIGVIPKSETKRGLGKALSYGKGNLVDRIAETPTSKQREALKWLFSAGYELEDILDPRFPAVGVSFSLGKLSSQIEEAETAHSGITSIIKGASRYIHSGRRKKAERSGEFLFAVYLAREGVIFWPHIGAKVGAWILPQSLEPLFWTFAVNAQWRNICKTVFKGEKRSSSALPFHRELLLRTNFFQLSEFNSWILPRLKEDMAIQIRSNPKVGEGRLSSNANLYFRLLVDAAGLDMEHPSVHSAVRYFGYGVKLGVDNSTEVYAWANDARSMRSEVGKALLKRDGEVPEHVVDWAAAMREGVALLNVKSKYTRVHEMSNWLFYVWEIGPENAPKSWSEIRRNDHIRRSGNPDFQTFIDFLEEKRTEIVKSSTIRSFDQIIRLCAIRDGIPDFVSPVDLLQDAPVRRKSAAARHGRTPRKSLHEELLEVVIEENRRATSCGLPFAFARSKVSQHRKLGDGSDAGVEPIFFPAAPIALDMILTTGMRSRSALWMDSGEGDEFWVDRSKICLVPNILPSAQSGCKNGYLRIIPIGPGENTIGMYLATNKTDPYEVPWVDGVNAGYFELMRAWQIENNPRRTPVVATRHRLELDLSTREEIGEVFPVFRDPRGAVGSPLTRSALYDYWAALLRHCEPIYNERRRERLAEIGAEFRWEPLLRENGKPRWDLHSLRVTVVTTLIDAGVSPEVVAILVGHKTIVMTWHYVAVRNDVTQKAIQAGLEARRQKALSALDEAQTDDQVDDVLNEFMGSVTQINSEGSKLLKVGITDGEPNPYEVFSHGICPGASCALGRDDGSSQIKPVFRPQACSMCRFRITGPAFLNGLVLRLNALMVEINSSFEVDRALADEVARIEDAGRSASRLEARLRRHKRFRDELWAEWAAELVTIRRAEAELQLDGSAGALMVDGQVEVSAKFEEVHALQLMHEVVTVASITPGAAMDVPTGTRAMRDEVLMEIARQSDAAEFFYRLSPERRRAATDAFGDLITRHARALSDQQPELIERLLTGDLKLPELRNYASDMAGEGFSDEHMLQSMRISEAEENE